MIQSVAAAGPTAGQVREEMPPYAPAAPLPDPAAYAPSTAPAATFHEAHPHDPKAGATPAAGLGTTARDITELIAAADLKARHGSDEPKPLFNPDAPFSLPASGALAASQDVPFTVPPPPPAPAKSATKATKTSKAFARPSLKISRNAILAVAAIGLLAAFALWSLASTVWAGSPADAWDGGNRVLLYLVVYALFALWPWRPAGAAAALGLFALGVTVVGSVALAGAAWGDDPEGALIAGLFSEPAGYHNANAALFLLAFWPAVYLASRAGAYFPSI